MQKVPVSHAGIFYALFLNSEKALYEVMCSCDELAEFRDKLGDLNVKNAIAVGSGLRQAFWSKTCFSREKCGAVVAVVKHP